MTDQEIIRKAVELADGWYFAIKDESFSGPYPMEGWYDSCKPELLAHPVLDALAAQLVRQVDVLRDYYVVQTPTTSEVMNQFCDPQHGARMVNYVSSGSGPDRTLNTLRAIVESKVLE